MTTTRRHLSVPADLDRLADIRALVREVADDCGAPEVCMDELVQAVDEAATNVAVHGYRGGPGDLDVTAELVGDEHRHHARGHRTALRSDPRARARCLDPARIATPGGMGIHLMRLATDSVDAHHRGPVAAIS